MKNSRLSPAIAGICAILAIFAFVACGDGDDTETVATPTANPVAATYDTAQSVTLECATAGATIYYSLDGTTPSTLYSGAITISETTTLKAIAKKGGMNDSDILTAVYIITVPETPEFREATINLDMGDEGLDVYHITVNGTLTTAQWEGIAPRLETVIQSSFDGATRGQKTRFVTVFENNNAVIVVEKDAAFDKWSVSNKSLLTFDFDFFAGQSDEALAANFIDITLEMRDAPAPEVAKANGGAQ